MQIGDLARRTGVPTKTIRYYEEIGVLPEPKRARNGYRDYPDDAVDRLEFIREAQATGLTLTEIGSILDLRSHGEATCRHVIDLLERHLDALDRHMTTLRRTRRKLAALTERAPPSIRPIVATPTGVRPSPEPTSPNRARSRRGATCTPPRPVISTERRSRSDGAVENQAPAAISTTAVSAWQSCGSGADVGSGPRT